MKKVMLIYPPGRLYQRGEDRSQGNIENSTATSIRACNDLGYAASLLKQKNIDVFLKDYQTERLKPDDLKKDFIKEDPDAVFMSITNATIFEDLHTINELKDIKPSLRVVLKGAIFYDVEREVLNLLDLKNVDCLIGGEVEFAVANVMDSLLNEGKDFQSIPGILYKTEDRWEKSVFHSWNNELDKLPFPNRRLMNNSLYVRPDTGEPQATIATSRGCPSACIFCLTPKISGTKVRLRSIENILDELKECCFTHGIRNFFFKSDTFTIKKEWTVELCRKIIESDLNGKIQWVANSKTKPLDQEILDIMKEAGCWLVAFGYESGSEDTLKRIKKGVRLEDNLKAAQYARKAGLKTFGFYLIGFPWETMEQLKETERLIFQTRPDFLELHLATPYTGTPLYEMAVEEGLINETVLGRDYFTSPTLGTKHLSMDQVNDFQKRVLLKYHLQPSFILRRLKEAALNPKILFNYGSFGLRLIKDNIYSPF